MLYSVDSMSYVKNTPHKKEFDAWMNNLQSNDYQLIEDELNSIFDHNEINTSGWIPGSDWTDTVYQPIYEACGRDVDHAAMFFGLIVFETLRNRSDVWGFGRYTTQDGVQIQSMTYFKLKNAPAPCS